MRLPVLILVLTFGLTAGWAQNPVTETVETPEHYETLTGGFLRSALAGGHPAPLNGVSDGGAEPEDAGNEDLSPGKALVMSALLPGAGEYYAGAKKKAAVFFGLEVLAWSLYVTWDGKGNDIEDEFRLKADEEFRPEDYLAWRETNTSNKTPITHELPCEKYIEIYKADRGNFGDCAGSEVQQYYELIGKYDQFVAGWSDLRDANGNPTQPVQVDSAKNFDSEIRQAYEDRRDDSNRHLKRAINVAGLALINHVISGVDAARMARGGAQDQARREPRTRLRVAMQPASRGSVPMLMAFRSF